MRIPQFTVHSEQPAWRQVVKALVFFAVVCAVLVGSLAAGGWGLGKWHDHQNARAERSAMAALGLRRICSGRLSTDCMQRAADAAKVPVASVPTSYADVLVATGPRQPGATVGRAPIAPRATQVRYAAFEQTFSSSATLNFDLVTDPTSRPGRGHARVPSITVDGANVDLWVVRKSICGCDRGYSDVWAEWHHDHGLYAAWFVLGPGQGSPAKVLQAILPTLRYTAPAT